MNIFNFLKKRPVKAKEEIDNVTAARIPFVYIFVRKDLPSVVKLIQVAHATYKLGWKLGECDFGDIEHHFCVFEVKNMEELLDVKAYVFKKDLECEMFFEPDFDLGYTALAVEPLCDYKRDLFKGFKLLKMNWWDKLRWG